MTSLPATSMAYLAGGGPVIRVEVIGNQALSANSHELADRSDNFIYFQLCTFNF